MKLETLMIKAIHEFKKANPKAEIRSCYVAGGFGSWQNGATLNSISSTSSKAAGSTRARIFTLPLIKSKRLWRPREVPHPC